MTHPRTPAAPQRTRRVLGQASRRLTTRQVPAPSDVRRVLRSGGLHVVVQPILDLTSGRADAYEALARFTPPPVAEPQAWFAAAARCGLAPELEAAAIAAALELRQRGPAGVILSVNVSPSVLGTPPLERVLPADLTGLQFEITEHELADDVGALLTAIARLRDRGARVAVDDVGQGYAGLKRIMGIRPDVLKLDREIVAGVSREPAKVAMLEAVVHFAARTGSKVCAEGIENVDDLAAVAELDVAQAQGWAIGHPAAAFEPASAVAYTACAAVRADGLRMAGALGMAGKRDGAARDMGDILESLGGATDVRRVRAITAMAAHLLGCRAITISTLDGDRLAGADGRRLADFPTARLVLTERTIGHLVVSAIRSGTTERRLLDAAGCRSALLVPLVSGAKAVGLLQCFRADEQPWSRADLRAARMLAAALGPVLTTARRR